MSTTREINELTPVPTLDLTALFEIEQGSDSFRTNLNDMLALATAQEFLGPWTANHLAGGFDLLNLGGLTINNPTDTFQYIITPDAIVADRILNLPLLLSADTFVTELHSQTLENKTIDFASNTITTTFAQLNAAVSDATLVDLDDVQTLTNKTINSASNTITIVKADISDFPIVTADIADDNVTFAKLQNIATQTFIGRTTAGSGDPEELSAAQATAILDTFTTTLKGLAPGSGGGTTNFLRADGNWTSPSGAGEQNTISSDGGGLGLTATISKVGVDLRVRSLAATLPISVGEAADLITITSALFGSGNAGHVPSSGGGTVNFLRADGTWVAPPSTGYATIEDEGTPLAQETVLNFVGAGVTASAGAGETVVTISGGGDMVLAAAQTVTGAKTFADDAFLIQNPAITFAYLFQGGAIVADRTINLPILTGNDTLVFEAHAATLTNKTLTTPTIGDFTNANHDHLDVAGGGTLVIDLSVQSVTGTTAQFNTALSDNDFATLAGIETLTNKSIDLLNNTLTTTFAQLNTAVSDATLVDLDDAQTLTNKTLALGSNTISGTTAEFNAALTDNDFATLAGIETLTNKSINLLNNTITGTTAQFNTALSDGDFATLAGVETLTNKTINLLNNTLQTTFAQLNTAVSDATLVDLDDAQTLTNKSIDFASNTITTTFAQLNTAVSDATLVDLDDAQTLTNKTIDDSLNTLIGVVNLTGAQTLTNKTINSVSNTITIVKADISDFPIVTADITDDAVTFAKTQNIATDRFLGRITALAGNIEELTPAQATSMLDQFTAALQGVVPLSGGGTLNFLRADGTWDVPPGAPSKSGSSTVARNGTTAIVFNTAFATAPNIVVNFEGNVNYLSGEKGAVLSVFSISTTGFTVRYDEPNGTGPNPATFQWIALVAGDP